MNSTLLKPPREEHGDFLSSRIVPPLSQESGRHDDVAFDRTDDSSEVSIALESRPSSITFDANTTIENQEILIEGEAFRIEIDGPNSILLTHPQWSLVGHGSSLPKAEISLRVEAREVFDAYNKIPLSRMSVATLEFRDFLLRII